MFFQEAVNGGKRITDPGTRQGTWILAPDGTLLGHVNTRDAVGVRGVLESALARWNELPEASRHLPEGVDLSPAHRWEDSFPADGLVLVRTARDLSSTGLAGERSSAWNRDFAWFSAAEVDEQTHGLEPGSTCELPLLAARLARFHLVDNVRGQTLPYAPQEVLRARLTATVTARVGEALVLRLEGETEAVSAGPWLLGDNLWKPAREFPHGLDTRLHGRAVFDREQRRFTAFELVGVGRRSGRTENNARRDPTPSLLAFHLALDTSAPRVAPTFVAVYDAPWIVRPKVDTWNQAPEECGLEKD